MTATRERSHQYEALTELRRESLRGRTLVAAIDEGPASGAVARVARQLAERYGSVPCVVRAFETTSLAHGGRIAAFLSAADAILGRSPHEAQERAIRAEVSALLGKPVGWPVHIHPGTAASVIVSEAAEREAVLILMGLRRHGLLDRLVRDEATLNVVRAAGCAVLGIAPSLAGALGCAVVGMDFTRPSIAAAEMTSLLLPSGGTMVLVHVRTGAAAGAGAGDGASAPPEPVSRQMDAVVAQLAASAALHVVRVVEDIADHDSVAAALLAVAGEHRADLITVGSRRLPWAERTFDESVSTELVRDGRTSVLVVPPAPHPYAHELPNHAGGPDARAPE